MIDLVNALTNKGYERGRTLFGAPYDFRYAPGPHASAVARNYLTDLKGLIEQAYTANDNQPVVLLSHSMGALWSLYFLNNQQTEWRQKFVAHFVTIAAPWGGTVEQMLTFASGNSVGVPFVDPLVVRKEQRSSESNLWLLPVSWVFGKHRPLVISSSGRSYTAADMKEFLHDIITPAGFAATTAAAAADLHQSYNHLVTAYESRVPHLTEKTSLQAPQVPVTLIYGHGVPTAEMLSYEEKSNSSSKLGYDCVPKVVQGDGDGTVNLCSLTAVIQEWGSTPGQILEVIALSNKSHRNILLDKESLEVIVNVILNTTTTTTLQQQDSVLMQS
jgi:lysophospholipase-3